MVMKVKSQYSITLNEFVRFMLSDHTDKIYVVFFVGRISFRRFWRTHPFNNIDRYTNIDTKNVRVDEWLVLRSPQCVLQWQTDSPLIIYEFIAGQLKEHLECSGLLEF